jgi:Flp pilus assembly protein CpaB
VTPWQRSARRLRRRVLAHRRLVSALLAALAVAVSLRVLAPPPVPTVAVVVAARDLGMGTPLSPADVLSRPLPAAVVPDGVLASVDSVVGRMLAGPVRRGEPLTDARLVGPSLLARAGLGPGVVATPVRLADPGTAALLRPGDRVDLYAVATPDRYSGPPPPEHPPGSVAPPGSAAPPDLSSRSDPGGGSRDAGAARLVASGLLVLSVPAADPAEMGPDGALVVFAATSDVARALAHAAATSVLSVVLRAAP